MNPFYIFHVTHSNRSYFCVFSAESIARCIRTIAEARFATLASDRCKLVYARFKLDALRVSVTKSINEIHLTEGEGRIG